jgi:hypothetical protein
VHWIIYFFIFLLRWLLHVSAKQCHPQGATMFLSEPLQHQYGRGQVTGHMTEPTYQRAMQWTEKVHYQVQLFESCTILSMDSLKQAETWCNSNWGFTAIDKFMVFLVSTPYSECVLEETEEKFVCPVFPLYHLKSHPNQLSLNIMAVCSSETQEPVDTTWCGNSKRSSEKQPPHRPKKTYASKLS